MRTQEEGLLTPADIPMVLRVETELRCAAHGDVPHSLSCAACRRVYEVMRDWFAAHAFGPEEADAMEAT